jgi:hypothetical protein
MAGPHLAWYKIGDLPVYFPAEYALVINLDREGA